MSLLLLFRPRSVPVDEEAVIIQAGLGKLLRQRKKKRVIEKKKKLAPPPLPEVQKVVQKLREQPRQVSLETYRESIEVLEKLESYFERISLLLIQREREKDRERLATERAAYVHLASKILHYIEAEQKRREAEEEEEAVYILMFL